MRVIFLDFDGCLNNEAASWWQRNFSDPSTWLGTSHLGKQYTGLAYLSQDNLAALGWIFQMCDKPDDEVKVAITSTWRNYFNLEDLRGFLAPVTKPERIVGTVEKRKFSSERGHNIKWWAEEHKVTKYAVIDDILTMNTTRSPTGASLSVTMKSD